MALDVVSTSDGDKREPIRFHKFDVTFVVHLFVEIFIKKDFECSGRKSWFEMFNVHPVDLKK